MREANHRTAPRRRRRKKRGWRLLLVAGALLAAGLIWQRLSISGTTSGTVPASAAVVLGDLTVPAARAAAGLQLLPRRPVVFTWEGQEWFYSLAQLGVQLQDSGAVAVDPLRLAVALREAGAAIRAEAEPARIAVLAGEPVIIPDRPGRRLNAAMGGHMLRAALQEPAVRTVWDPAAGLPPPLRLPLPVQTVTATPTARQLLALGIRRRIASFTTRYDPEIPRGENVERAARALNGLLLRPGELFSYNASVGPVSADTGWREAYVILGGELVPGVGGGICQTATTVYGAALRAGLTVAERHPHELAVAYAEPSQDAAISPGLADLKLRNTLATGVLFQVQAGGGAVTVEIWGDAPRGLEIRVESKVVGDIGVPLRVITDPTLPPGTEIEQLPGHAGFRSEAWRTVLHQGEPVSRELLSTDVYAPSPRVIRRGPTAPGPPTPHQVGS